MAQNADWYIGIKKSLHLNLNVVVVLIIEGTLLLRTIIGISVPFHQLRLLIGAAVVNHV